MYIPQSSMETLFRDSGKVLKAIHGLCNQYEEALAILRLEGDTDVETENLARENTLDAILEEMRNAPTTLIVPNKATRT